MRYEILVIDDHETVLSGLVRNLGNQYPEAEFVEVKTAQAALAYTRRHHPDVVVTDLSIPQTPTEHAQKDTGIDLLKQFMQTQPTLNIVVHTSYPEVLVRLKPMINTHEGGFAIAPKSLSVAEMLKRVDWALQGLMYTPKEMRTGLECRPEWLQVLTMAFQDGLQDQAIAQILHVSERTVRNYWTKVQDMLEVYPEPGKNIRIQTAIRAREVGLID